MGISVGKRRLMGLGLASLASPLAACGVVSPNKSGGDCASPPPGDLIVDIHCHIMNLRDADDPAFVVRHVTNSDETSPSLDLLAGILTEIAAFPNRFVTMSGPDEFAWLRDITEKVQTSPQTFCDAAADAQNGLVFAGNDRHVLGFASNRARSDALLMARYPKVDIFTPLMVDFHEGRNPYSHPSDLVDFYSQLNIATLGRFLPMVSFNPSRAWEERHQTPSDSYLRLIKTCIEEKGFVGVKLHPSTGYAPINNATHGCPNTPRQRDDTIQREQADFYDKVLFDLFLYCRGAGVPIMTHSGEGIPANAQCMRNPNLAHNERPNAPANWEQVIRAVNDDKGRDFTGAPVNPTRRLRVCFAHMAGGLSVVNGRMRPHPWLKSLGDIMRRQDGLYVDLSHQENAFNRMDQDHIPSEAYRTAFVDFLATHPALAKRLIYGSDWHMPRVALIGRTYLDGIAGLVPADLRSRTMGWNAADYLGLRPKEPTHERLVRFYRKHGIERRIAWMDKITG